MHAADTEGLPALAAASAAPAVSCRRPHGNLLVLSLLNRAAHLLLQLEGVMCWLVRK
jgi:hypothetical protein